MRHLLLFTVLLALLPALVFSQTTIPVAPGTNTISAAVAGASSGDILELEAGTFIEQNTVVIDKALIIRAKAGLTTMPVWQVEWVGTDSTQLMMKVLDHFWLDGIKLDGKTVAGDTIQCGLLTDKDTKVGQNITLTNCEFVNYLNWAVYGGDSQANNVLIEFCTFAHILGGDYEGDYGTVNWFFTDTTVPISFNMENCTIYDTYGRSIYVKASNALDFLVDHVTIAVDTTGNWGEKCIEVRTENAMVRNCIVTCYPDSSNSHGIRMAYPSSTAEYIYAGPFLTSRGFWKPKNDFTWDEEKILDFDETILTFTDPANGDFSYPTYEDAYFFGKDGDGNDIPLGDLRPFGLVTIDDEGIVNFPTQMQLHQNYPNPFNPQTTIGFNLPVAGQVSLTVYNILGQEIVTLVNQQMKAGHHSVTWNASSVSSGIYFYKIQTDNRVQVRKMVLLK